MAYHHNIGVFDPKFKKNRQRRELEDMLGEWYGRDYAASEVTCRTDQVLKLGDLLDAVLEDKLNDQAMLILDLREKWDSVIGPPLNKFIRLVNVKDSTVVVEVSHPAFLMELRKKSTAENCLQRILERYPQLQADSIM